MNRPRTALVALALASNACIQAWAETGPPPPQPGETAEIRMTHISAQRRDRASSGSSRSNSLIVERIIAARDGGLELEYDLPSSASAADRSRTWQFPTRIFRSRDGRMELLNASELETRIEAWLKAANLTREACGRWYFTWNAFRVECDPHAVIGTLEVFDLRVPDLRAGAPYRTPGASAPSHLEATVAGSDGTTFVATMAVDPDHVRRTHAEQDVVAGEITKQPVTLEEALRRRSRERISGTIVVTLDTDGAGAVRRRTKVAEVKIERADGDTEENVITETVERMPVPAAAAPR